MTAIFIPAIGEQINNSWDKGIKFNGKDYKFLSDNSFFKYPYALQSMFYGFNRCNNYRERMGIAKDIKLCGDSVTGDSCFLYKENNTLRFDNFDNFCNKLFIKGEQGWHNIKSIKILTTDKNNNVKFSHTNMIKRVKCNKNIFEVRTIGGRNIKVTEDHSLFTLRKNKIVEIKGSEIKKKDYIIGIKNYDFINNIDDDRFSDLFLEIVGMWFGDGYVSTINNGIGFSLDDKDLQEKVKLYFNDVNVRMCQNNIDMEICNKKHRDIFNIYGLYGTSLTKKFPDWIFNLSKRQIGLVLKGYMSCDGSINKNDGVISWGTISYNLHQGIQILMLILGIHSNSDYQEERWFNSNNKKYKGKLFFNSTIYSKEDRLLFQKYIGFGSKRKQDILLEFNKFCSNGKVHKHYLGVPLNDYFIKNYHKEYLGNYCLKDDTNRCFNRKYLKGIKEIQTLIDNDILYLRVKSVKKIKYKGFVYDFSVPETERFIVNNLLAHNSGGFEIASSKLRGEPCDIRPIDSLRWQEENCDIVMALDVPPSITGENSHKEFLAALKESKENFALFEKERKNYNAWMYNVQHGDTPEQMELWYEAVKDFKFEGWASGMKPASDPMLQAYGMMFLWDKGEFNKPTCKGAHFFGVTGKTVVPLIVYIGSKLKNIMVTYDSSSYNIGSIYRRYIIDMRSEACLFFGDKFKIANPDIKVLPCTCPVCSSIKDINVLNEENTTAGVLISLHNMWHYINYNQLLNSLVENKELYLQYLRSINMPEKLFKSIEFVDYVIENGMEKAVKKYEQDLFFQPDNKTLQKGIFEF